MSDATGPFAPIRERPLLQILGGKFCTCLQVEGGVLKRADEDSDSERSGSTDSTMVLDQDVPAGAGGAAGETASDAAATR